MSRATAAGERATRAAPVETGPSARPPPFRIPGRHFAAGSAFLVLAGLALAWRAPALAAGALADPGLLAATHLLTLGWITTSIMGALYQLLPVALGASVRWERLAALTFWAWTAGVVAFVAGLAAVPRGLLVPGAAALGVAIVLFALNVAATLPRAARRGLGWWCIAAAVLFLLGAWVLGLLLAVNLRTGILGGSRPTVLAVHLHIAAGGWVLLTMIGVADRLLPMFLLSHGATTAPGRVAAVLVAAGAALLVASEHVVPPGVLRPALAAMAAGTAAFLLQAVLHYRHRRRPRLDPGMRLVAGALALLALALISGLAVLFRGTPPPRLLMAYGILLVPGGLGLFVAGNYYKIVPFLTWFHRFGPVAADREVPRVADLFDHRLAHGAAALLVGGVLVLAAGTLTGSPATCAAGGTAYAVGASLLAVQMLLVSRQRPA